MCHLPVSCHLHVFVPRLALLLLHSLFLILALVCLPAIHHNALMISASISKLPTTISTHTARPPPTSYNKSSP
jgi:hypothetical protein